MSKPSLLIESTDSMMIILCVQVTLLQIEELLFYFLTYINIVIVCIRTVSVATCIFARSLGYKETPIMSHSYCFLMCLPHSVWFKYVFETIYGKPGIYKKWVWCIFDNLPSFMDLMYLQIALENARLAIWLLLSNNNYIVYNMHNKEIFMFAHTKLIVILDNTLLVWL